MSHAPSPASSPKSLASRWGCGQAILGLILGGSTALTLILADPFDVTAFTEPQGVAFAQRQAAYDQWKRSPRVVIGSSAMTLIPLLVSGVCGIFLHKSFPSSIPAALLRMTGIASLLFMVSTVGSQAIDYALSTGESSDIRTPLAMLAFEALCISLAAPFSSIVTRRQPRGGHPPAKATR